MKNDLLKIRNILANVPDGVFLRVGIVANEITLEPVDSKGDWIDGVCPLFGISEDGEYVENDIGDGRSSVEVLTDRLNN